MRFLPLLNVNEIGRIYTRNLGVGKSGWKIPLFILHTLSPATVKRDREESSDDLSTLSALFRAVSPNSAQMFTPYSGRRRREERRCKFVAPSGPIRWPRFNLVVERARESLSTAHDQWGLPPSSPLFPLPSLSLPPSTHVHPSTPNEVIVWWRGWGRKRGRKGKQRPEAIIPVDYKCSTLLLRTHSTIDETGKKCAQFIEIDDPFRSIGRGFSLAIEQIESIGGEGGGREQRVSGEWDSYCFLCPDLPHTYFAQNFGDLRRRRKGAKWRARHTTVSRPPSAVGRL